MLPNQTRNYLINLQLFWTGIDFDYLNDPIDALK